MLLNWLSVSYMSSYGENVRTIEFLSKQLYQMYHFAIIFGVLERIDDNLSKFMNFQSQR